MGTVRVRKPKAALHALTRLAMVGFLALILSGCARTQPDSANFLPGKPVFQVDPPIIWGPIFKAAGYDVPLVTIWDNGRTVFRYSNLGGGPSVHETVLKRAEVEQILEKARFLYDLGDSQTMGSGGSNIRFSVETELGRKVVWVRGFDPLGERPVPVDESEDSRRLRDLWATVQDLLPSQAPLMQPDEVVVFVEPDFLAQSRELPTSEANRAPRTWPKELVGHLKGEQARSAASLLHPGALDVFLIDGKLREVTVQPALPLLYEPTPNWPRAGIPRHPAVTAYDAPGMPFRFTGVTQREVADWYLNEMPVRGWRLAGQVEGRQQVWAWEQHDPSPLLVILQFLPTEMTIRRVELLEGIPLKGRFDICGEVRCQVINETAKAKVETWFAEFMPYAGWQQGPEGDYRKGSWQVRLEMREADLGGTAAVQVLLHRAWVPSQAGELAAISGHQAIEEAEHAAGSVADQAEHVSARLAAGSELIVRDGIWRRIAEQDPDHPYWIVTFAGLPPDVPLRGTDLTPPSGQSSAPDTTPDETELQVVVDALTGRNVNGRD